MINRLTYNLAGTLAVWFAMAVPAAAAVAALHAYEFRGDLSDSGTGSAAILAEGGVVGSEHFAFDPIHPGDFNEGLTLKHPQLTNFGVYTIEMRLKLDTLRNETPPGTYGPDQGWIKVLDFTNNEFSQGLYVEDVVRWEGPGLEGRIEFIASGGRPDGYDYVGVSPNGVIKAQTWFHTVLTRNSSGLVVCYVDGVEMFQFQDAWDDAVIDAPDNTLRFMQPDDYALTTWPYPVIEVTQGDLDYFRIYNQALSAAEAIALYNPPLASDFNGDEVVDAQDLTIWKSSFGVDLLGDANDDGVTDGADFLAWQREFQGNAVSPIASIPEPSTLALSVAALSLAIAWHRHSTLKLKTRLG